MLFYSETIHVASNKILQSLFFAFTAAEDAGATAKADEALNAALGK